MSRIRRIHGDYVKLCLLIRRPKEKQLGLAPGEVFAAIAMAMHEFQSDVHDVEDTVLTITRVKRSYSPWSSKIYTLRETPHKSKVTLKKQNNERI